MKIQETIAKWMIFAIFMMPMMTGFTCHRPVTVHQMPRIEPRCPVSVDPFINNYLAKKWDKNISARQVGDLVECIRVWRGNHW